ncbi:hypothetical protein [Pyrococcus yayanosii]|uniref:Uncharacterized protein n=1 Tax=Pyrococcus yayanosii (strain CH1 / JCM 16557) TaxID=529709 RepID=F8AHX1_PYRYC|nr:hypothetical protein [Pyrococcus yayanosii]AEH24260.1 hypothetical protein PYCH_05720 [Pyrococcus yayanosii CH1]
MAHLSFYFTAEEEGFPVLITADEPIFLTDEPVPVQEFMEVLKMLAELKAPGNFFRLKIVGNGGHVTIKLPDDRDFQVPIREFTKNIQRTIENISSIMQKKPVKVEHLRFRLLRPGEFWNESDESYLNEYDVEIYGDIYILNATINLKNYIDDLKKLKEFIEKEKLPKEEWRVVWDTAQLKPGLEKALSILVRLASPTRPPFVRFTLGTYDPLEIIYVSSIGGMVVLFFVAWAKITVKVSKGVLLKALDEAIINAERELERLKA